MIKIFRVHEKTMSEYKYDITIETVKQGTKYTLFYSNDKIWLEGVRSQKIISIIDNGNGYFTSYKYGKNIHYSEAEEIRLLLNFIESRESIKMSYEILEVVN